MALKPKPVGAVGRTWDSIQKSVRLHVLDKKFNLTKPLIGSKADKLLVDNLPWKGWFLGNFAVSTALTPVLGPAVPLVMIPIGYKRWRVIKPIFPRLRALPNIK